MTRTSLYLHSQEELDALKSLADELESFGQRGAGHNPLIQEIAQWYMASPETTAYHFREARRNAQGALVAESETIPEE